MAQPTIIGGVKDVDKPEPANTADSTEVLPSSVGRVEKDLRVNNTLYTHAASAWFRIPFSTRETSLTVKKYVQRPT